MDARRSRYHEVYARWKHDPEGFWGEAAQEIDWMEPAKRVFDPDAGIYGRWFVGGVCNTCWNAVDRHVMQGRGEQPAIIYDSPLAGQKRMLTYHALRVETQVLAAILRNFGVEKGDRVVLYMPMVPEAAIAMLACARIGAVHSVVFGGFAANELSIRIDDAKPKVILSASCGLEPGRIVKYKSLLDEAIRLSTHKPDACLSCSAHRRRRCWLPAATSTGPRRATRRSFSRTRGAGRGHRPALHPLHLGHHRATQGCSARQRRPHGRPQMVDAEPLRCRAGGGVLGRL
jgi:AMP-binding enzyme/Acetyl-coenzyme A synthetase N-terminus